MNRRSSLLVAAGAVVALAIGYALLPQVTSVAGGGGGVPATDTLLLSLPPTARVLYRSATDEVDVGDTLLSFRYERYALQRDSLLRFASVQRDPPSAAGLPGDVGRAYREILAAYQATARAASLDTVAAPSAGEDQELLLADLAGAEDAATETLTAISQSQATGRGDSSELARLRSQLAERQAAIRNIRARIAEAGREVRVRQSRARAPRLTQEQRIRIAALARELPQDTAYALAERSGRYLPLADVEAGAIVPSGPVEGAPLYALDRGDRAALWATATRVPSDSLDATRGGPQRELLYVVRSDE